MLPRDRLNHVVEFLSQKFICQIQTLLMSGTVNERRWRVRAGEYLTATSRGRDRELLPAGQINSSLMQLLSNYESQTETDLYEILNFYMKFEQIFPFEDVNSRVGRLLMFKGHLCHGVIPFIIENKHRLRYLRGIREWDEDRYELKVVALKAQDRFETHLELKRLSKHGHQLLPEDFEVE